jgi:ABC-type uncharacterized transport system substrate-binding protein
MEQMGTRPLVETGGLALLLIAILVAPVAAEELPVVTLGVLVDGESERMESLLDTFTTEILALTRQEIDLRIPEGKLVIADWTRVGIETDLERLLGDPEVDVVLALGAISAHVAAHRGAYPKPLIAPFAVDANVQGFPFDPQTGGSGVHNFTYANILAPTLRDIQKFLEIDPFIRRLAVILQPALHEEMPELGEASLAQLEELGIEAVRVPARATPEETVAAIPSDVDAVYVLPLMRFGDDDIARLADGLKQRRLPSFSMYGRREVELGLLACLRTEEFLPRLARRMALSLQQVLLGEESGAIPVTFLENPRAVINMRTVREVGAFPSIRATFGAELLHQEQVEGVPLLRLTDAVIWAVDANLDLAAFDRQVAAGRQSVAEAKGLVRPRVTASSLASAIDADRAAASFGSQPERSFDASLALDQIIYAEPVFANVTIQNRLQESLEVQREQLRLDIVREAATAYLDVLRAHGIFEIQHENYLVTLKNRDLAEIRQRIGAAGASEVYRWQSAIATAEGEREAARRVVEIAKVNLNRVLDRPQNTKFIPEDVDHSSDIFMSGDIRTWQYVYSLPGYEIYIEFMVGEGLERSFELAAIDAAIAAAERSLVAARRQLYIPRFSLRAEISEVFSKSGGVAAAVHRRQQPRRQPAGPGGAVSASDRTRGGRGPDRAADPLRPPPGCRVVVLHRPLLRRRRCRIKEPRAGDRIVRHRRGLDYRAAGRPSRGAARQRGGIQRRVRLPDRSHGGGASRIQL